MMAMMILSKEVGIPAVIGDYMVEPLVLQRGSRRGKEIP